MLIREARPEDKQELLRIVRDCWNADTARRADIELDQAFRGYDWRPVLYVAQSGGIVGCAAFIASWTYFGVYDITWVNVAPIAQRCGAGKALIEKCLAGIRPPWPPRHAFHTHS